MRKSSITNRFIIAVILMVAFFLIYETNGVSKKNIENDARLSQQIGSNFLMTQDETNSVVAILFYNQDTEKHIFSIYVKKNFLLNRYVFKSGGEWPDVNDSIGKVEIADQVVYLSLNNPKIEKVILKYDKVSEEILINRDKPFVIIVPNNATLQFFNDKNELYEC